MQRITRACYFDLMLLQFNRGPFLLAEARECLGIDFDKWELIKDKFTIKESRYYNERLQEEIDKRKSYCESKKKGAYAMHTHMHTEDEDEDEIKNENKDENSGIRKGVQGEISLFDQFWKAYPKKVGKAAAEKSWEKIKAPTETLKIILINLEWQIKSEQWIKEAGQYIPMPVTYLNQARWLDEKAEVKNENNHPYRRVD